MSDAADSVTPAPDYPPYPHPNAPYPQYRQPMFDPPAHVPDESFPARPFSVWSVLGGLGLFLLGQTIASVVAMGILFATGDWTQSTLNAIADGHVPDFPSWALALMAAGGWLGLLGFPWLLSRKRGGMSTLGWSFTKTVDLTPVAVTSSDQPPSSAPTASDQGPRKEQTWKVDALLGVATAAVLLVLEVLVGVLWKTISGAEPPTNTDIIPSGGGFLTFFTLWLVVGVGTPIAEEVFFRGLTLRAFAARFGSYAGIITSACIFGALHVLGTTSITLSSALYIGLATGLYGLAFALVDSRRNFRLVPGLVGHAVINTATLVAVFYLPK